MFRGCGKSTYIKNNIKENEAVISRDAIRFSMLNDNDEYFSREKEVYNEFIKQINDAVAANKNVYIDQTSLNRKARAKLFNNLKEKPSQIIALYFTTPIEIALARNSQRTGRALVPDNVIIDMYNSIEYPIIEEGFTEILEVKNYE